MFRSLLVASALVVVLASVVVLSPVEAGRGGGGGKGGGKGGRTSATLVATPNTVEVGGHVTLDAAGLKADSTYYVGINQTLEWYPVGTDSQGKFTYMFPDAFNWIGSFSVCVSGGATPLACMTVTVE